MPQKLPEMKKLQIAQVRGVQAELRDPQDQSVVSAQCSLRTGEWCELEIPWAEAMRLSLFLREIEKDSQKPPK
jgi:hypothetical protein